MKLKVKDMDIATGSTLVAILNEKDARKLDLHALDRIKIKKGKKIETVVIDIAESEKAVPVGKIGIFEEVIDTFPFVAHWLPLPFTRLAQFVTFHRIL